MAKLRRRQIIIAILLISGGTAAAATATGSAAITRMMALIAAAVPGDAEQRAKAKHGWTDSLKDSVIRGRFLDYDANGMLGRIGEMTMYRQYPDKLRIEIERRGATEVKGVDGDEAWKEDPGGLSPEAARDIRALLRIWPERLFTSRSGGAKYRQAGRRTEDRQPGAPGQVSGELDEPIEYEVVEIVDRIGSGQKPNDGPDERRILYYIGKKDSLVSTVRWIEPDDPRKGNDPQADATEIRVDFGRWQEAAGVMWPMEIVHRSGGRVDYRIEITEVRANQGIADSKFRKN